MTSRRAVVAALVAALLVGLVWFLWPRHGEESEPGASIPSIASTSSTPTARPSPTAVASTSPLEISHLADPLNSPTTDIRADLRIIDECLANYRSNFPHDGNPVGSNAEITAVLTGKNKLRYAVIPPNHPAIKNGELCDRWGTPFFFHAESGTRMIVRSAGPDKKLYTADDVVFSP